MKDQPFDDYNLTVSCIKGLNFNQTVTLTMYTDNVSVIVQTEKAIYKPSDTVKFRVLLLDENLKPLAEAKLQVYITDGVGNRVEQFDEIDLTNNGVFEGDFKLADAAILGNWNINVLVNERKEVEKIFEVAEYTLPTFEVRLDVEPHANYDDKKMKATVVAKHTFGKAAKGNVTVTAEVERTKVSKSMEVNGKSSIEFHIQEDLGIGGKDHDVTIKLFASFKEQITSKVQNATANVEVHVIPYKITMKKKSKKFKPGLPFAVEAIVQYYHKNVPVTDTVNAVKFIASFCEEKVCDYVKHVKGSGRHMDDVTFEYVCVGGSSFNREFEVYPVNGIAKIDIPIPDNIARLNVTTKYQQAENSAIDILRASSEENHFITITSITEK